MAKANEALWNAIVNLPEEDGIRRFPASNWLQNWNSRFEMSSGWSSSTLAYWHKTGKVAEIVRDGRRIVGVRLQGHQPVATDPGNGQPEQAPDSAKQRVLGLLQRAADSKGRVRMVSDDDVRQAAGLDYHDFAKILWDLKKDGLVAFREKKVGSKHELHSFQLRGRGMPGTVSRVERVYRADTVAAAEPWQICPECYWGRKFHEVAPDDSTLLMCPFPPKPGSPRATGKPAEKRPAGKATPPRTEKPSPVTSTWRCSECDPPQEFSDPVALNMHKQAKHTIVTLAPTTTLYVDPTDTASEYQPGLHPMPDAYPAIRAMLQQQAARMQAVKALEAAGEDDMALTLLGKVEAGMDPVHAEALRLARALGWEEE